MMPEMSGLDAFRKIMEKYPIPTIILSALNPQDMDTSIQALLLGAFDYVIKPGGLGSKDLPRFKEELLAKVLLASQSQIRRILSGESALNKNIYIRQEFVNETFKFGQYLKNLKPIQETNEKFMPLPKEKEMQAEALKTGSKILRRNEKVMSENMSDDIEIKHAITVKSDTFKEILLTSKRKKALKKSDISPIKEVHSKSNVIVIGASVGGPKTLITLLKDIPSNISCPILIVQHLSNPFIDPFVKSLKNFCEINVKVPDNGELIQSGTVYFAPSSKHMEIIVLDNQLKIRVFEGIPINFCIPSIDVLFLSASRVYKNKTLGILLTGMGNDGVEGLEAIKNIGGKTIAESKETCILYGMSRNAIERNLADLILPNYNIANYMIKFANTNL